MTVATQPKVITDGQRVVLYGIDWPTYETLRNNPENRHVRMTYDQGTLELMSPLQPARAHR